MTRALVLRPEPGSARTLARLAEAGIEAVARPLFEIVPLPWTPPSPEAFDALLLTSANGVRHAGPGLGTLAHLPVVAVGAETARVAKAAGLTVAVIGDGDGADAVARVQAAGLPRLLHLAGRDHVETHAFSVPVYASVERAVDLPPLDGMIALLHSRRAAEVFAALVPPETRAGVSLVAISATALAGAGDGWARAEVAEAPNDPSMVALTLRLARD
jgi:uroporphyrinogen-III synthase